MITKGVILEVGWIDAVATLNAKEANAEKDVVAWDAISSNTDHAMA